LKKRINRTNEGANKKTNRGFTLLEVMIALFVIAVALGGVIKVMGNAAINTSRLSNRTFAQWVALNRIAKLQTGNNWPSIGEKKGKDEMANQEWRWVQKTMKTYEIGKDGKKKVYKEIKRIELSVWNKNDDVNASPYVTVVGFLKKPRIK